MVLIERIQVVRYAAPRSIGSMPTGMRSPVYRGDSNPSKTGFLSHIVRTIISISFHRFESEGSE